MALLLWAATFGDSEDVERGDEPVFSLRSSQSSKVKASGGGQNDTVNLDGFLAGCSVYSCQPLSVSV